MRDFQSAVEPIKVETELGAIYVRPNGSKSVTINAPHLTVDGVPLQASAFFVGGDGSDWGPVPFYDSATGRFSRDTSGIRATLVDGREADIIVLGKIAQVIVPVIKKLAQSSQEIFIEAERRAVINEIVALERKVEDNQTKIKEKEAVLAQIEQKLPGRGNQ